MLIFQVEVSNVFEKCRLSSKMSSRRLAEEVGEPDFDIHWIQEIMKMESVKLGGPTNMSARLCPIVGPPS